MNSINLSAIKKVIDNHKPTLPRTVDMENIQQYFNDQNLTDFNQQKIQDLLAEKIKLTVKKGHHLLSKKLKELERELIHEQVIVNTVAQPYLRVLDCLRDNMRSDKYSNEFEGSWEDALKATIDYIEWSNYWISRDSSKNATPELRCAIAMKRLRGIGKHGRNCTKPSQLTSQWLDEIFKNIEKRIIKFGGKDFLVKLFAWLNTYYDESQMRYHYINPLNYNTIWEPKVPIGLLINLAAKHPLGIKPLQRSHEDFIRILDTSKEFACLYDSERNNPYAGLNFSPDSINEEIKRIALHDSLFQPVQLRPTDVPVILNGLLDWFYTEKLVSAESRASLENATIVLAAIQRTVGKAKGPVVLSLDVLSKNCTSIERHTLKDLINSVFAHPERRANHNFNSVTDVPDDTQPRELRVGPNLQDKPLLIIGKDRYLIVDHSICAPAMIEAILGYMRALGVKSDIGYAVEHLISNELAKRNVIAHTGKYSNGKVIEECDLVIETEPTIIFMETKAKSLTKAGKAAFDPKLLKDLFDSFVHAIIQTGKHSIKILNDSKLVLNESSANPTTIVLCGREIERVAVTLHDFGGFQYRTFIDQLLLNHLSIKYLPTNTPLR